VHDVLDPRDLVPDEAEQLTLSGYEIGDLQARARAAAAADDLDDLSRIAERLATVPRSPSWEHHEPDDQAALTERLREVPAVSYDAEQLPDRVLGAWLGRTVGNTIGKPIEGLTRGEVETYLRAAGQWPLTGFLPLVDPLPDGVPHLHPSAPAATVGNFSDVPRDDDIDWTILALHVLEAHGRDFTTEQVAAAWLDRVPFTQTYTAERAAYRNLIHGLRAPDTATRDNPYREWIGALIRGDAFGYVSPGDPAEAARLALVDARLSHTANGLYGEMWAAALTASALASATAHEAFDLALPVVPERSRLRRVLGDVRSLHQQGADRVAALDWVDDSLGQYPWVHTLNNAAIISIGLLWGEDFLDAVGITISGGRDTDSNGATVGSVWGALHGTAGIPQAVVGTTHDHVRSAVRDFDRIRVEELATRTLRLVRPPVQLEAAGR
jgi:ADP-ribosylglycohydrolase